MFTLTCYCGIYSLRLQLRDSCCCYPTVVLTVTAAADMMVVIDPIVPAREMPEEVGHPCPLKIVVNAQIYMGAWAWNVKKRCKGTHFLWRDAPWI